MQCETCDRSCRIHQPYVTWLNSKQNLCIAFRLEETQCTPCNAPRAPFLCLLWWQCIVFMNNVGETSHKGTKSGKLYLLGNKFSQVSCEFCGLIIPVSHAIWIFFFCSCRVKGCPNLLKLFQVAREVQDIQIQWTEMTQVPMWNNRIPNIGLARAKKKTINNKEVVLQINILTLQKSTSGVP